MNFNDLTEKAASYIKQVPQGCAAYALYYHDFDHTKMVVASANK